MASQRQALEAALATARATVLSLEAALAALDDGDDPWLDLAEAAKAVPVRRSTLETWVRSGQLRAVTAERGRKLIRRSWLDAALESRGYAPSPSCDDDPSADLEGTGLHLRPREESP